MPPVGRHIPEDEAIDVLELMSGSFLTAALDIKAQVIAEQGNSRWWLEKVMSKYGESERVVHSLEDARLRSDSSPKVFLRVRSCVIGCYGNSLP